MSTSDEDDNDEDSESSSDEDEEQPDVKEAKTEEVKRPEPTEDGPAKEDGAEDLDELIEEKG